MLRIKDLHEMTGLDCGVPANCRPKGVSLKAVAQFWQSPGVGTAD